jgi:deoxycytidine triphosphate deaminase
MKLLPSQGNPFLNLLGQPQEVQDWTLCSTTHVVLTPEIGIHTLPTGVFGPLPEETWGFLLGRSSSIVEGLQVYSGIIDNDYEGEIKIMAVSPHVIITVPANQKLLNLS